MHKLYQLKRYRKLQINTALSLDKNYFLTVLKDEILTRTLLESLGWCECGDYLTNKAVFIINNFIIENEKCYDSYFNKTTTLDVIANQLIEFIYKKNVIIEKTKLFPCVADYEMKTSETIRTIVGSLSFREKMKILGYGLREGEFEKNLSDFIIKKNISTNVELYGYEPNSEPSFSIINLSKESLYSNDCPFFDLIVIRWVLHHVDEHERWQDLIECLKHTNLKAKVIIIEEGLFINEDEKSFEDLIYEFLLCIADVIINYGINNRWMINIATGIEPKFAIKYLSGEDIEDIEKNTFLKFHKKVIFFPDFFIPQVILEYDVLNNRRHQFNPEKAFQAI